MCIFSPQFRRQKQQLHQNSFEQYNTTSEAVWLGYLLKLFFFCGGNISSGKHRHGQYSLLQNLTLLLIEIPALCAGAQVTAHVTNDSGQTNKALYNRARAAARTSI